MPDTTGQPRTWLDLPLPPEDTQPPGGIPGDLRAAVDRLAAIMTGLDRTRGLTARRYFARDPGRARLASIIRRLPPQSIFGLFDGTMAEDQVKFSSAFPENIVDGFARRTLFARIFNSVRVNALQEACAKAAAPALE